jgi:hypothetical protein
MFCHGELVRLKPSPKYLTRFYLMISLGGAGGSVLVGLVAPLVLPAYFELAFALVLLGLLLVWQARREHRVFPILGFIGTVVALGCAVWGIREFYDRRSPPRAIFTVCYASRISLPTTRPTIIARLCTARSCTASSISRPSSGACRRLTTPHRPGIGRLLEMMHPRIEPLRVGMIGLGAGTLATYGSKGDVYRIYDINPAVIIIANRDFTFLRDSDATIETPLGDARLKLEREAPQQFDVLAVDAFSSDAIPVHLITSEAVAIYKRHIKPGGVIAFHVTNRFLNLIPVVDALGRPTGCLPSIFPMRVMTR